MPIDAILEETPQVLVLDTASRIISVPPCADRRQGSSAISKYIATENKSTNRNIAESNRYFLQSHIKTARPAKPEEQELKH